MDVKNENLKQKIKKSGRSIIVYILDIIAILLIISFVVGFIIIDLSLMFLGILVIYQSFYLTNMLFIPIGGIIGGIILFISGLLGMAGIIFADSARKS